MESHSQPIPLAKPAVAPPSSTVADRETIGHPLGSILYRDHSQSPASARFTAAIVLAATSAVLGVALYLTPDSSGIGTHRQLGFAPCSMVATTGYPCPTCGMTTAFAHTVRGQFASAARAQVAGLVLALTTIVLCGNALATLITGRPWKVNWYRIHPRTPFVALLGLLLLGWVVKILLGLPRGATPGGV